MSAQNLVPLREDEYIILTGATEFDPQALLAAVGPLGFEPHIGSRSTLAEWELKRLVREKGVSYVWRLVELLEAVLPQSHDLPGIVSLLTNMISRLAPTQDFVIVDRYLLPKNKPTDYLNTLVSLLGPMSQTVSQITLVTDKKHDAQLLTDLVAQLSPPGSKCQIAHRTSEAFHDRFWIADRQRGLFIGTSLNGIGARYALADYMDDNDVHEIVSALVAEGLL
jgi:hypothetical protein